MVDFGRPGVDCQVSTPLYFPAVKHGLILEYKAKKSAYLNQLNVNKPLVTSISPKSEDLRPYIMV
jgi:hypothetical protein